jgi:hypothetical protein
MTIPKDGQKLSTLQTILGGCEIHTLLQFIHQCGSRFGISANLSMSKGGKSWKCVLYKDGDPRCSGGGISAKYALANALARYLETGGPE